MPYLTGVGYASWQSLISTHANLLGSAWARISAQRRSQRWTPLPSHVSYHSCWKLITALNLLENDGQVGVWRGGPYRLFPAGNTEGQCHSGVVQWQSAVCDRNDWTRTGTCLWRLHGAESRPGAYTITRGVRIIYPVGWRHPNSQRSLPVGRICSQHEVCYSWLRLDHIRCQGQPTDITNWWLYLILGLVITCNLWGQYSYRGVFIHEEQVDTIFWHHKIFVTIQ